jgi:hypothetical protein
VQLSRLKFYGGRQIRPLMTYPKYLLIVVALSTASCGGGQEKPPPAIEKETAAGEIIRIGTVWTNATPEKGILSPPSKVSLFRNLRRSELRISENAIVETLTLEEEFQLRDGPVIKCSTHFEHQVGHRWGRKNGEAAVEITRPALNAPRSCDGVHPDGPIAEPARTALFVLRSDSLVAIEPLVDKRTYTPGQL